VFEAKTQIEQIGAAFEMKLGLLKRSGKAGISADSQSRVAGNIICMRGTFRWRIVAAGHLL
jgi:hypothetical protein